MHSEDSSLLVHTVLPSPFHWQMILHFIGVPLVTGKVVPIDRHLVCFEYFAVINNAAVKILDVSL